MPSRKLNNLKEQVPRRLFEAGDGLSALVRVGVDSGLLWEVRLPGIFAAVRAITAAKPTPAHIYRIHAKNSPDKPCMIHRGRTLTFQAVDQAMDNVGSGLLARGFGKKRPIVLMMRNRPEFIELQCAAARIGAPAVSLSWRSTAEELAFIAGDSGAFGIAFDSDFWPVVQEAKKHLPHIPEDHYFAVGTPIDGCARFDALENETRKLVVDSQAAADATVVIYTSGTTGKPKGAVRTFSRQSVASFVHFLAGAPFRVGDVHLAVCPLYHATGFAFLEFAHVLGQTAVLLDEFKPAPFLEYVERYQITTTVLVPTMLQRIMALGKDVVDRYDTRSLRVLFSASAPLPGPLAVEAMDYFGDIVFNLYGSTETGLVTLAKPSDLRACPSTIGRLIGGNELRLLDDAGQEVPAGQVGELYVRSGGLVDGYHGNAKATRDSMRDGFFSVGDLARCDVEGRYFIEGRKRDMIISGGVNIYPAEVEAVFEQHPAVAEVAVIGVRDAEWGERVCAVVVSKPNAVVDDAELKVFAKQHLASPKVPREIVFMDSLPRNPTGKVLKRELRELREKASGSGAPR